MTTTEARPAAEGRLLTAGDLLRLHGEGVRGELIRGVLQETMSTGVRHGKIAARLIHELMKFTDPRGLGTVTGTDTGVRLERDPDTVREPDVAFFSAARLPLDADTPGYSEVAPDLAVEVRSPADSLREVHDKARMWLSHGVRLVWVVDPAARSVDVHRPGEATVTLAEGDALDGGDALPGFACEVSAVFGPPAAPAPDAPAS